MNPDVVAVQGDRDTVYLWRDDKRQSDKGTVQ